MGEWVNLDTHHGVVRAWQATPEGRPRGGLVVIQEIFGVTAHIRAVADDYAAQGYQVLAPAFFDQIEPGLELDYDGPGTERGRSLIGELGWDKPLEVVQAAASRLAPAGRVGTVGYCWGGTVALLAALRLGRPSVSYYGARNVQFLEETPKAPVLFHFGEHDASIPPEAIARHRQAWPQAPIHVYPADHAFNRNEGHAYDAASATLARQRTLDFLAEHVG